MCCVLLTHNWDETESLGSPRGIDDERCGVVCQQLHGIAVLENNRGFAFDPASTSLRRPSTYAGFPAPPAASAAGDGVETVELLLGFTTVPSFLPSG